jgi:dienelactone hydrolase
MTATLLATTRTPALFAARCVLASALALLAAACATQASAPAPAGGAGAQATDPTPPRAFDPAAVLNQTPAVDYKPPEGISFRASSFFSDNVRLTAQWFHASNLAGQTLPTVVMAHGWGGTAAGLRRDAVDLARAGYLVMLFDYRGWGDSDSRVVLTGPRPTGVKPGETYASEVRELRGYIDPWEQTQDWFNAIAYATTQPMVDVNRVGIRGSSYSGGHVVYVAAHEPRVKALVAQVPGMVGLREPPFEPDPAAAVRNSNLAAARLATGEAGYPAERAQTVGSLIGAPIGNKTIRYSPVLYAGRVSQPALFLMAEKEELFSNESAGIRACNAVTGPRKAVMIPEITHYGIYGAERELAIKSAIDWFDRYLKAPGGATRIPIDSSQPERGDCKAPFVRPPGVAPPAPQTAR